MKQKTKKGTTASSGNKASNGNGHGAQRAPESPMQTYREGERFPGRIGRTWDESKPAFPMPPKAPPGAPNILYVIIDDIGFGWTEPFGGMIHTPNLMRLAENGLEYTNFHTTALCSPTRACLITGRKPWENTSAWSFDQDRWELYELEKDPAETNDLMKDRDKSRLGDPIVKRCLDLVSLWWAEAGRYQVLPLDDRFQVRALGREALYAERAHMTFYEGSVRIQPFEAPQTLNRSWALSADVVIPEGGAEGPIAALGGTGSGWSVYLKSGVPTFCYNFSGAYTYVRARQPLAPGRHVVRCEFEKTGKEAVGAGGTARLFVDDEKVAEGDIERTCPIGYTIDETFDIGWDKGTPVSEEYGPIAKFTGKIERVAFDLHPDFSEEARDLAKQAERKFAHAMLRQ